MPEALSPRRGPGGPQLSRPLLVRLLRRAFFSTMHARVLGVVLVFALSLPLAGDLMSAGNQALASLGDLADTNTPPLRILAPSDASPVGDGNLVLVETAAIDRIDGVVDDVEVAIDDAEGWADAE